MRVLKEFLPGMCYNTIESPKDVTEILLESDVARFSDLYWALVGGRSDRGENSTHVLPLVAAFPTPFFGLKTEDHTRHYNLVKIGANEGKVHEEESIGKKEKTGVKDPVVRDDFHRCFLKELRVLARQRVCTMALPLIYPFLVSK